MTIEIYSKINDRDSMFLSTVNYLIVNFTLLKSCFLFFQYFAHYRQGQTGLPGRLALARWAVWSASQMGRHVKC